MKKVMMLGSFDVFGKLVAILLTGEHAKIVKATKFYADDFIIRATRKTFGCHYLRGNIEIIFTMGKPNYKEREFIKQCKKAGEPFPINKIQIGYLKGRKKK